MAKCPVMNFVLASVMLTLLGTILILTLEKYLIVQNEVQEVRPRLIVHTKPKFPFRLMRREELLTTQPKPKPTIVATTNHSLEMLGQQEKLEGKASVK